MATPGNENPKVSRGAGVSAGPGGQDVPGFKKYKWALAGLFFLALVLRVIVIVESGDSPYHRFLVLDAATYHKIAVKGDPAEPFWQPPLYPWLLRGVYALTGGPHPPAARVFQAFLGAATCLLIAGIVRRLGGSYVAGLSAGCAGALYGTLIYFDNEILPAGPAAFWVTLWVWALLCPGKPDGLWVRLRPLVGGLMLGVGGLLLPVLAIPGALVLIWFWRREGWQKAVLFATAACVVIAPVTLRNWRFEKSLVPVSWNGGVNLWIGNNPDYPASMGIRPGIAWTQLNQRPRCEGKAATRAAESAWFSNQVLGYLAERPVEGMRNLAWKGLQTISAREIGRNREIYDGRYESILLRGLIWRAGFPFGLLFPLALIGVVAAFRRGTLSWLPVLVVLGILACSVIFFPTARYRIPAVPLMLVLAGAGLPQARRWDWLPGVGAVLVCLVPPFVPEISRAETMYEIGVDLDGEGKTREAAGFFEQALSLEPGHTDAHLSLGLALGRLNREEEGRKHLELALQQNSRAGVAWTALSLYWQRRGESGQALECARRAVKTDPCDRRARGLLANLLMDAGHLEEARAELEEAGRRYPRRDPTLERAWNRWRSLKERREGGSSGRTGPGAESATLPSGSP